MNVCLVETSSLKISELSLSTIRNMQASILYQNKLLWLILRNAQVTGKREFSDFVVLDVMCHPTDWIILQEIGKKLGISVTSCLAVSVSFFTTVNSHGMKLQIGSIIDICFEMIWRSNQLVCHAEEIDLLVQRFCGDNNVLN